MEKGSNNSNGFQRMSPDAVQTIGIVFIQTWNFQDSKHQEKWLDTMGKNVEILQRKPGYLSMQLYLSLDGKQLVVYGQWENEQSMLAAVSDPSAKAAHTEMVNWSKAEPNGNIYRLGATFPPIP